MAIGESTRSWIESHILNILSVPSLETEYVDYISDTSIPYENVEQTVRNEDFIVTNLSFADDLLYDRIENGIQKKWALFSFYIANRDFAQHSGRVVWIDVTPPAVSMNVNKLAPSIYIVTFKYPGDGYNFYIKQQDEWRFTSPVTTNVLYIDTPLTDIQEIAIASNITNKSTIALRRNFYESTTTV